MLKCTHSLYRTQLLLAFFLVVDHTHSVSILSLSTADKSLFANNSLRFAVHCDKVYDRYDLNAHDYGLSIMAHRRLKQG